MQRGKRPASWILQIEPHILIPAAPARRRVLQGAVGQSTGSVDENVHEACVRIMADGGKGWACLFSKSSM